MLLYVPGKNFTDLWSAVGEKSQVGEKSIHNVVNVNFLAFLLFETSYKIDEGK